MDFEHSPKDFEGYIATASRAYVDITRKFVQNVEYWNEISPKYLGGQVTFKLDGSRAIGSAIGKKFSISISLLVIETQTFGLAVLSAPQVLSGEYVEIDRFLISTKGSVHSVDRALLLGWEEDYQSYRLLVAIVRKVLNHSPSA